MDIAALTEFFKYCTIINFSILLTSFIILMATKDFAYNVHTKLGFWEGSKESHKQTMYSLLGNYKILIITLNAVPYFALCCCM